MRHSGLWVILGSGSNILGDVSDDFERRIFKMDTNKYQKLPTWSQKGAKKVPKLANGPSGTPPAEQERKSKEKGGLRRQLLGATFEQNR